MEGSLIRCGNMVVGKVAFHPALALRTVIAKSQFLYLHVTFSMQCINA